MGYKGAAVLVLWHDISKEADSDYNQWHSREHLAERLSCPGFLRARRGIDRALPKYRYLTIYEGESLEAFRSPFYLERLNNPSPWTSRIMPAFRNFLRVSCRIVARSGAGIGGATATYRYRFASGANEQSIARLAPALAKRVLDLPGVCCVLIAVAQPEVSSIETTETRIRPQMNEPPFDVLVVVDGTGRIELDAVAPQIAHLIENESLVGAQRETYDLAHLMEAHGNT